MVIHKQTLTVSDIDTYIHICWHAAVHRGSSLVINAPVPLHIRTPRSGYCLQAHSTHIRTGATTLTLPARHTSRWQRFCHATLVVSRLALCLTACHMLLFGFVSYLIVLIIAILFLCLLS